MSDIVFEISLDPGLKIWLDPDSVFFSRVFFPRKSDPGPVFSLRSYPNLGKTHPDPQFIRYTSYWDIGLLALQPR